MVYLLNFAKVLTSKFIEKVKKIEDAFLRLNT